MGVVPTVVEATEFSLSEGVANAVDLMEETLLKYLKSLNIDALKQSNNVTIHSVLPHSFKSADAYSL